MDAATGDFTFGRGLYNYWYNVPEGVAQHIVSRLMLWTGQWFEDSLEGTPWQINVLGERTVSTRDLVVQSRVRETPHVTVMNAYTSRHDPETRTWAAAITVTTEYGPAQIGVSRLPGSVPPLDEQPVYISPFRTKLIGVTSGETPITMVPADVSASPHANISNFTITGLDGKTY
jgi:hypothetical protein